MIEFKKLLNKTISAVAVRRRHRSPLAAVVAAVAVAAPIVAGRRSPIRRHCLPLAAIVVAVAMTRRFGENVKNNFV